MILTRVKDVDSFTGISALQLRSCVGPWTNKSNVLYIFRERESSVVLEEYNSFHCGGIREILG